MNVAPTEPRQSADDVADRDAEYVEMILRRVRVSVAYRPKFGRRARGGLSLAQFQGLYRADPFYAWFGLDSALLYAAHKAAGGMTSLYRQIGLGCESVFRQVLQDSLGLSQDDTAWSYDVPTGSGTTRKLSLDSRVPLAHVALRQRAEYTHKFNLRTGRHGWLRLTPAYSVKMVEETIAQYGQALDVLDPFCGSGTTALCAAAHGHRATTVDINPFLTWLARAKTDTYSANEIADAERAGLAALDLARRRAIAPAPTPDIHRIERWWTKPVISFLASLKAAIAASTVAGHTRNLLLVAFCRTLIKLSSAAFNHQSMSFKNAGSQQELNIGLDPYDVYWNSLQFVLRSAADNPIGAATVLEGDARNLSLIAGATFGLVITSPPYANRMSYIRELRPYMYWLGYLAAARDAGELDWRAIGGTWGVATSRLNAWSPRHDCRLPDKLHDIVARIAAEANANGALLAAYVAKYCEDMSRHFASLRTVLKRRARVHYIVGNSTFYGVLVPTEQLYAGMLREYGFTDVLARPVRKRNSNRALVEFEVTATWPASRAA